MLEKKGKDEWVSKGMDSNNRKPSIEMGNKIVIIKMTSKKLQHQLVPLGK